MYPKVTKVEKYVWSRALESGVEFFSNLLNINDTVPEEGFTPLSIEVMVRRCLNHYLQPYKKVLLNEDGYPSDFKLNEFVREVKQILKQHKTPAVQHKYPACVAVTVDNVNDVSANTCIQSKAIDFIIVYFFRSIKDG